MISRGETHPANLPLGSAAIRLPTPERDIARAQEDYQRLRAAYLALATEDENEVALAMVGADMDRAHATLQKLIGLRQLGFSREPSRALRRGTRLLDGESS